MLLQLSCGDGMEIDMYKVGDLVVYGANGLMKIVDIREENVLNTVREYYVLGDISSSSSSQVFVPTDNKKLTASMRPILTRAEVMDLISRLRDLPRAEWHSDNRVRSEDFRRIIESGDREGMLSIIKAVYENGIKRSEIGKKNYLTDESFMRKAQKLIEFEFATVLGIDEKDVADFIKKNM